MIYIVDIRRIIGSNEVADLLAEMRRWLDRNRIEPESLEHSSNGIGIAIRVGFRLEPHAEAFACAFAGRLLHHDPCGAALWELPQSQ